MQSHGLLQLLRVATIKDHPAPSGFPTFFVQLSIARLIQGGIVIQAGTAVFIREPPPAGSLANRQGTTRTAPRDALVVKAA